MDELLDELWAYRTTSLKPTGPTGPTSFALTYGMVAIILTKIRMPATKTTVREIGNNNNDLEKHLNWANEEKEMAAIRIASYQQMVIA